MQINTKIFRDLRKLARKARQNPDKYRQRPQDFTRRRKLNFSKLFEMTRK